MEAFQDLSVGVLARDKLSSAPQTVARVLAALRAAEVLVVDIDYPRSVKARVAALPSAERVRWVPAPRHANTNVAFNRAVAAASRQHLLVIENDVSVTADSVEQLLKAATAGYDIAVPVILETDGAPHFDPPVSRIEQDDDGVRSHLIRRPAPGEPPVQELRRIAHLEKHCFLIRLDSARKLGPLDEEMHCRTDLDMSMHCWRADIRIASCPDARVAFSRELDVALDAELFRHRWDLAATEAANRRLVEKWKLADYTSSVRFAQKMQDYLTGLEQARPA